MNEVKIRNRLSFLSSSLIDELIKDSNLIQVPENTQILAQGDYVKGVPIVVEGLVKVFTSHQERELLLYYIKPEESCVMSFAACLRQEKSSVFAITEQDSQILMLPIGKIESWLKSHPDLNKLFFNQYNQRYSDLLDTIHHVLFNKMDVRVFDFLKERSLNTGNNPLAITHRRIAEELGTAREVVTRTMKKLEGEGKIVQLENAIQIL